MSIDWDGHWLQVLNSLIESNKGGYNLPTMLIFDEYREWYEGDILYFEARPKAGIIFSGPDKVVKVVDGNRLSKSSRVRFWPDGSVSGWVRNYGWSEIDEMIGVKAR